MRIFILCISLLCGIGAYAQEIELRNWQFSKAGSGKWFPAKVPGNIYTDLHRQYLIASPFISPEAIADYKIDESDWTYRASFHLDSEAVDRGVQLRFPAIDTYARIYVNGVLEGKANNAFRNWTWLLKNSLIIGRNELKVAFKSAKEVSGAFAKDALPVILPDHPRVYSRKPQYQFGWDFGPAYPGCGLPLAPELRVTRRTSTKRTTKYPVTSVRLIQTPDSAGQGFYFEKNGSPLYIKGANWIPANIFPAEVTDADYRSLLLLAKKANMNMLRVWGGGIYEKEIFYDLCDSLGIMVWQDFMFAGGMNPGDEAFFANVREEVLEQVKRLRKHKSVVLWCGNNEIDEAWNNWGWQKQFNLNGADSAKVWNDYKRLFSDSIPAWIKEAGDSRPYISTSPMHGWGREKSYNEGDSHYWGLWWGLEGWEKFKTHTGRFVSEYGMQAMPHLKTVETFTKPAERSVYAPQLQSHQRANAGMQKLHFYLDKYFIDSTRLKDLGLDQYVYLTQVLQHYILKNSIAVHRSKQPYNMGTMLWQLNDCWPGITWSIIDFYKRPKAAWYAVREAYRDDLLPEIESIIPKEKRRVDPRLSLVRLSPVLVQVTALEDADYVWIDDGEGKNIFSENYFHLRKNESRIVTAEQPMSTNIRLWSLYDVLKK